MNQIAGFYCVERSAARAAAFLRGIALGAETILGRTGVRADWMEQDGPAMPFGEKMCMIGDHGFPSADYHTAIPLYTDTISKVPFVCGTSEIQVSAEGLF